MITLHSRSSQTNINLQNRHSSSRLGIMLLGVLLIFFSGVTAVLGEVVISEDFNTGTAGQLPDGWYVDNGVWEHGVPTVGPANCAGGDDSVADDFCAGTVLDGNHPAYDDSHLISPPISLPSVSGADGIYLRFWHWFSYYSQAPDDSARVQISIRASDGTWSEWLDLGNPILRSSPVWDQWEGDLTSYAGETIRLAFFHVANRSLSYVATENVGWYLDNVEVTVKERVFTGDFELGWQDWWADNGVWEIGTPSTGPGGCYESEGCAGTVLNGNYQAYTDSRLISAPLTLPSVSGADGIYLRFWHWFSYYSQSPDDSAQVQISVRASDGTWSDWVNLGNPILRSSPVWDQWEGDLTNYAGETIRLAFFHLANRSLSYVATESTGWYLDNIEVSVKERAFTGDFELGWQDWWADNGVWEIGTPSAGPGSCYESEGCAGTILNGNYQAYTDSRLISAPIELTTPSGSDGIYLHFWHWFSYYSDDKAQVQFSIRASDGKWGEWINLGDQIQGNSGEWIQWEGNLTDYANQTIRLAFFHMAHRSLSYVATESTGWYIDDITLNGQPELVNHPPILDPIGNQTVEAGELLTFPVTATDPDGDSLTLTVSNLPAGATFSDNGDGTGQFSWQTTAEDEGTYGSITFKVTDSGGLTAPPEEITITVGNVNLPPVLEAIGDQSLIAGELFTLTLTASDPDVGDTLTFMATDLPIGATLTDNSDGTAEFNWAPDADLTGNFLVTFIVTDDGSPALSDSEEVTLTVGGVNRPPILDPIGNQVIPNGEEFSLLLTASDPDGDDLSYEVSGLPTNDASFTDNQDGTAELLWTPDESVTGNYWMTFKVNDNGVPSESDAEFIHISVGNMNRPPVMGPVGNHGITPGEPFRFALHASDPEGDALRFIVAGLPEDAGFVDNEDGSAEFSWDPTEDDIRNHKLLFRVIDEADPMASDWEEVTFTVSDINRPPMLSPIGNRIVDLDQEISMLLTCRDPDGDAPSYDASDLPADANLTDNQNGTASFTWTPDQAGNYTMTFNAYDEGGEGDSETIVITVGSVNRPPVLNPIGDSEVDAGESIWIPVIAGDPDGDLIDLSVLNMPEDATFTDNLNGTGEFEWPAELEGDGINPMSFIATDLGLEPASTAEDVTITVRGECELPEEPEDLKVKATKKKVTLTWEYEGEVDHFTVYRSVDNEVPTEIATTADTSYTENLPNDFDRIEYSVSAVNACGESELEGPVVVRPKGR